MTKRRITSIIMLAVLLVGIALAAYGMTGRAIYSNAAKMMGSDEKSAMIYIQDPSKLKELGKIDKPILLKRGLANNIKEFLMSAEYIMAGGNENVILCERGVRTFETYTRNTLDLSAVAVLHELSHLPVVVDPSHATGAARYVKPMALAAAACGADGLMIEVHNDPQHALCDGPQSLTPEQFDDVAKAVKRVREAIG